MNQLALDDKDLIQAYLINFRSTYQTQLKEGIVFASEAVPFDNGVVVKIDFKRLESPSDYVNDVIEPNVDAALKKCDIQDDIVSLLDDQERL